MNNGSTGDYDLAKILKIAGHLSPKNSLGPIWCHPANAELLRRNVPEYIPSEDGWFPSALFSIGCFGVEIRTDEWLPRWTKKWEFPQTPFVEYEKSDKAWAVPLGFGHWVNDTDSPAFFHFRKHDYLKPILLP